MDAQHPANQAFPAPGVEFAHPRVLPVHAIAYDRIVSINEREKLLQVPYVELPIGVHKQGEVLRRGGEATRQGSSIALVSWVSNETNLGVSEELRGNDCSRSIGTTIVNNQHLEIQPPPAQNVEDTRDRACDDLLFVIGRQDDRETGIAGKLVLLLDHTMLLAFTGAISSPHSWQCSICVTDIAAC
jgi:hypothetical protein